MSALVDVGTAALKIQDITKILAGRNRSLLQCPMAPAQGLSLVNVHYDLSDEELHQRQLGWWSMRQQQLIEDPHPLSN